MSDSKEKIKNRFKKLDIDNLVNYLVDSEIINEDNYEDLYYQIQAYI